MARLRISTPAREDLENILATSLERWGESGRARYEALLAAALRAIDPEAATTRARTELSPHIRSIHIRHARRARHARAPVHPVHVIFYRVDAEVVEVVRVLHERMEPTRHITSQDQD